MKATRIAERFLPIPGYEGRYEVSDQGRIKSLMRGAPRILKTSSGRDGHLYAMPCIRVGCSRKLYVHRAVLLAFRGPKPEGLVSRHLNGVASDNRLENLVYGTASENMMDSIRHGTHAMAGRTTCPQGHPYSEANTYMGTNPGGGPQRGCRECRQEASRRYIARNLDLTRERSRISMQAGRDRKKARLTELLEAS